MAVKWPLSGRRYNQSHRLSVRMEDSDWTQPQQHALLNAPALAVKWAAESANGITGLSPIRCSESCDQSLYGGFH